MDAKQAIQDALYKGNSIDVRHFTLELLEKEVPAEIIINILLKTMDRVSIEFRRNELFVPEVLLISRAFNGAIEIVKPYLVNAEVEYLGTIVLGTIQGDLHSIGKNLVKLLLEGANFNVIDLGVDVSIEAFEESILKYQPDILGVSTLLTTTMVNTKKLIKYLEKKQLRQQVMIMVGGAPVTEKFANEIGADCYAEDAGESVILAKKLIENKKSKKYKE